MPFVTTRIGSYVERVFSPFQHGLDVRAASGFDINLH